MLTCASCNGFFPELSAAKVHAGAERETQMAAGVWRGEGCDEAVSVQGGDGQCDHVYWDKGGEEEQEVA